jgi:hypothetical protein
MDILAYIALRERRPDVASGYYTSILRKNKFDSRAEFGLGRTKHVLGVRFWPETFEHWRRALRFQTQSDEHGDRKHAWLTACSMAGLFAQTSLIPPVHSALLSNLGDALREEEPHVSSILIDAFRCVGITAQGVASTGMRVADEIGDIRLRKRLAQFLMALAINKVIVGDNGDEHISNSIAWCKQYRVLPEFLAGAKATYARVLIGLENSGVDVTHRFDLITGAESDLQSDPQWRALKSHISTSGPLPNYYKTAYQLSGSLIKISDTTLAVGVRDLIVDVARATWDQKLLDRFAPTVAHWRLHDLLDGSAIKLPEVGGLVDRELLGRAGREFGLSNWSITGARVEREINHLPGEESLRFYPRGGIFFRANPSSKESPSYLYFNALGNMPGLEPWSDMFSDDVAAFARQ